MTERVAVLMTPEKKGKSVAERLSISGYVRQRALGENEMLSAMLHELTSSTTRAVAPVDRTLGRLEDSALRLLVIEAPAHKRAMTEFGALDPHCSYGYYPEDKMA